MARPIIGTVKLSLQFAVYLTVAGVLAFLSFAGSSRAADFTCDTITRPGIAAQDSMGYCYWVPEDYNHRERLPVVVYLHGNGGNGKRILEKPHRHPGAVIGTEPYMAQYRAILIVPRKDVTWGDGSLQDDQGMMPLVRMAIWDVCRRYSCDRTRRYLMGHSSGGIGVWHAFFRRPGYFAAGIISAGSLGDLATTGSPSDLIDVTHRAYDFGDALEKTPLWVIHAAGDGRVSVKAADAAFSVLRGHGMKYTRIRGGDHRSSQEWAWPVRRGRPNRKLYDWLFSKKLNHPTRSTPSNWPWRYRRKGLSTPKGTGNIA